jgi:hypothetical protein
MEKDVCTWSVINGKWLKDSHLFLCIVILMSEEGRIIDHLQVRCFLKLVVMFFFRIESNGA